MLLRTFARRRPAALAALLLLAAGAGLLEGAFVLIAKASVSGTGGFPAAAALAILVAVVTARALLQVLAANVEAAGIHGWLAERRAALLNAAAGRAFPAYRDPWRNILVTSLRSGMDDLAAGLGAGARCLAALAHVAALAPALFLFGWRFAAASLALVLPAWLAGRLKSRVLGRAAGDRAGARQVSETELEAFAEGLESEAGNRRLPEAAERLGRGLDRRAEGSRGWEIAQATFPPALEWLFFTMLAALALAARATGLAAGAGPAGWIPFGALLILMYRPIREWARHRPAWVLGNRAFADLGNLQATLEAFPRRTPRPPAPGGGVRCEGVAFGYGAAPVFYGLDLALDGGELAWIAGPNGTGKSTLLKLIAGIEDPSAGRILGPGGEAPCAYLPQRAYLEPDYAAWARAYRSARPREWRELDGILGLDGLLEKLAASGAHGLSGGERQRLCLGRSAASPASFLLWDEPTTWLAAGDRERILGDLLAFWRRPRRDGSRRGGALVSHEPFVGEFCARTVHLGRLRAGVAA